MAYGTIIVNEKISPTFNLGDYVQSLAAMQFLPKGIDPILLERDNISDSPKERETIKVIMNGWWMTNPEKFPPSNSILPLYRSFHLRPKIEKNFFTKQTIEHLKKYQPIGCRDENTRDMMTSHGIKAYFSGCLTLTLGQTYKHHSQDTSPIYIVDPFVGKLFSKDMWLAIIILLRCLYVATFKMKLLKDVRTRIIETNPYSKKGCDLWLYSAKICALYSNVLGKYVLKHAIYRTHVIPGNSISSHEERLAYARQFLEDYSTAKYVFTSRIHCALPCLGMGTPVILVVSPVMMRSGRMGGVMNLFKSAHIERGKCVLNKNDFSTEVVDNNYLFVNYESYKTFAEKLIQDSVDFFCKNT